MPSTRLGLAGKKASTGAHFIIKMSSYQCRKFHLGRKDYHKTVYCPRLECHCYWRCFFILKTMHCMFDACGMFVGFLERFDTDMPQSLGHVDIIRNSHCARVTEQCTWACIANVKIWQQFSLHNIYDCDLLNEKYFYIKMLLTGLVHSAGISTKVRLS